MSVRVNHDDPTVRAIGSRINSEFGTDPAHMLIAQLIVDQFEVSPKGSDVRTETRTQFWREDEGKWVDHVLIRTWGPNKDRPTKWRHRVVTFVTAYGEWKDGRR